MPKTKNINAIPNAHNLTNSEFINGQRATNKKIKKNKIPKLLLFSFFFIIIDLIDAKVIIRLFYYKSIVVQVF